MIVSQGNVIGAQADSPIYFGITERMTANTPNLGYAIGDPNTNTSTTTNAAKIWNFIRYKSSTLASGYVDGNIFCVKAGVGFTSATESGAIEPKAYNVFYDMKKEREAIKAQNEILKQLVEMQITLEDGTTISRYDALLAAINMLYLPGESDEQEKTDLLNSIIEFAKRSDSGYTSYVELMEMYPLTDDDITAVQQAVIWYFTNYGEEDGKYDKTSDKSWIYYTLDGTTYDALKNYTPNNQQQQYDAGQARTYQVEVLYNYMIRTAKANASKYTNSSTIVEAPAKVTTTTLSYKAEGNNYIIGPIHITENANNVLPYTIDFVVKNNGTEINNYTLLNQNQASIATGTTVKDLVGNDFYISVPKSSAQAITVNIDITYKNKKITLWASSTNNQEQPLVIPEVETISLPTELSVNPKELDLALRKYITKVNGIELTGANVRVPSIEESTLTSGTTATYKHKKDPVSVVTGDKVTYKLTIYNEGEKVGRATKIVDQLPTGLKFTKVVSGNFELDTYNEGTNTLNLKRLESNTTNLPGYTTGNIAQETIEIECQVTRNSRGRRQDINECSMDFRSDRWSYE